MDIKKKVWWLSTEQISVIFEVLEKGMVHGSETKQISMVSLVIETKYGV